MSKLHATATNLHMTTTGQKVSLPTHLQSRAANSPVAQSESALQPRYCREPFETDGPATCLVWF